jgi:AraC-like DNA-binding protein
MTLTILIITISFGVILTSIVALTYSAIVLKKINNYFLAGSFFCILIYFLPFLLASAKLLGYFPYFLILGIVGGFLFSPLIYLFIESSISKSYQFNKSHLFFFVVPFIFFLDYLYFHFRNSNQIGQIVKRIEEDNLLIYRCEGFIPSYLRIPIQLGYVCIFIFLVLQLLKDKYYQTKHSVDKKSMDSLIHRILFSLFYSLIVFLCTIALPFFDNLIDFSNQINQGFLIVGGFLAMAMSLYVVLTPTLIYDFKVIHRNKIKEKEKNEASLELLNEIARKMNSEKFYLNPHFSSNHVLIHFHITRSTLDNLLLHFKGVNFADWLNSYRVEYAKKLLFDNNPYSIDALATMSGFNSRSAFYAAFKKVTKITPTEYIKRGSINFT